MKVRMTASYLSTGFEFKIIDCDNITGEFDNYILPELKENQIWDLSKIGNGIIAVAEGTGLNDNEFTAGLLENPTNGVFRLALENAPETINIKVCNLNGQIVYDAVVEVENGIVTIDITIQEKGVYLIYLGETENALRMIKQ